MPLGKSSRSTGLGSAHAPVTSSDGGPVPRFAFQRQTEIDTTNKGKKKHILSTSSLYTITAFSFSQKFYEMEVITLISYMGTWAPEHGQGACMGS